MKHSFKLKKKAYVIVCNKKLPTKAARTIFRNAVPGSFLTTEGSFEKKLSQKIWFFKTKKEAQNYSSDYYNWGSLDEYSSILPVDISATFMLNVP